MARIATAFALVGAFMVAGLATAEHANAATTPGKQCGTKGWVDLVDGVSVLPCAQGDGGRGVKATGTFKNPNGITMLPCAQLLLVNSNGSTTQVNDYGCNNKWTSAAEIDLVPTKHTDIGVTADGTYVVQEGFWVGKTYILGAQSGRVAVFG